MSTQPHIVFMNVAATGHMNPSLPLVAELRSRGCHVTYFVEITMRSVVEAAGAKWAPFRYAGSDFTGTWRTLSEDGIAKYVPEGTPKEAYEAMPMCQVHNAEAVLPSLLDDLRALQPPPSTIVYEPFLAFAEVAAQVLNIPAVALLTMPGPGVVVFPDAVADAWESKPWVEGPRKEIKDTYGVDVLEHGGPMEFYSSTLNLVTTIKDLYSPPRPGRQQRRFGHARFEFVGALTDEKTKRISNAYVQDSDVAFPLSVLDDALKAGKRVVYISMGTVATSSNFWNKPFGVFGADSGLENHTGKELVQHVFRSSFEAFGDKNDIFVVMSLGSQQDALEGLPTSPSNFMIHSTVPQLEVLKRSSVFITHGGANSMHESLSLAVPMLVIPIFGDQPANADTIVSSGAGLSFKHPMTALTSSTLAEGVERLMDPSEDNAFRAAASLMSKKLAAAGGPPAAANLILRHVQCNQAFVGGA
jgi:UDP:flavonoid glycosyltransferase YjiC (YdhE family)